MSPSPGEAEGEGAVGVADMVLHVDVAHVRADHLVEGLPVIGVGAVAVLHVPEDAEAGMFLAGFDDGADGLDGVEVAVDLQEHVHALAFRVAADLGDAFQDLGHGGGGVVLIGNLVAEDPDGGDARGDADVHGLLALLDAGFGPLLVVEGGGGAEARQLHAVFPEQRIGGFQVFREELGNLLRPHDAVDAADLNALIAQLSGFLQDMVEISIRAAQGGKCQFHGCFLLDGV